jgi:hypothetical protein
MTFIQVNSVFDDNGLEDVDRLSLNVEEVSSFNPSSDGRHTTVNMKNGSSHCIVCSYDEFARLMSIKHPFIVFIN